MTRSERMVLLNEEKAVIDKFFQNKVDFLVVYETWFVTYVIYLLAKTYFPHETIQRVILAEYDSVCLYSKNMIL